MAVKGNSQETKSSLVTGVSDVKVLAFCPTLADYEKIYGAREEKEGEEVKEPEYFKDDKEGNRMFLATFIIEDVSTGRKNKVVFPMYDKIDLKETGNRLFVNDKGDTSYVDMKENLKEFFLDVKRYDSTAKKPVHFRDCKVREGYQGEKAFLEFISMWLNLDFSADPETEIWIDMKRLFNGDFREMREVVNAFTPQTVLVAWHVKTADQEDGTTKQFQQIYKGAFSNTRSRKNNLTAVFNNLHSKKVNWEDWLKNNEKNFEYRNLRRFITQLTGDYKPDGFILQPLGDYDPTTDLAASQQSKHESPEYSTNDDY